MFLLPGVKARQFVSEAAEKFIRYLGGDTSLITEIHQNKQIAQTNPESIQSFMASNINDIPKGNVIVESAQTKSLTTAEYYQKYDALIPEIPHLHWLRIPPSNYEEQVHFVGMYDRLSGESEKKKFEVEKARIILESDKDVEAYQKKSQVDVEKFRQMQELKTKMSLKGGSKNRGSIIETLTPHQKNNPENLDQAIALILDRYFISRGAKGDFITTQTFTFYVQSALEKNLMNFGTVKISFLQIKFGLTKHSSKRLLRFLLLEN